MEIKDIKIPLLAEEKMRELNKLSEDRKKINATINVLEKVIGNKSKNEFSSNDIQIINSEYTILKKLIQKFIYTQKFIKNNLNIENDTYNKNTYINNFNEDEEKIELLSESLPEENETIKKINKLSSEYSRKITSIYSKIKNILTENSDNEYLSMIDELNYKNENEYNFEKPQRLRIKEGNIREHLHNENEIINNISNTIEKAKRTSHEIYNLAEKNSKLTDNIKVNQKNINNNINKGNKELRESKDKNENKLQAKIWIIAFLVIIVILLFVFIIKKRKNKG